MSNSSAANWTAHVRRATETSGDPDQDTLESAVPSCRRLTRAGIMDSTIKDFEAAIAELETIVKKLEEGDLPLETSLQLYERGVQLSRFCHAQLEQAEKRIEILNERGGLTPAPANFGADDESEGRGRR